MNMSVKEILRVLLKELGIPSIKVEDMEFSYKDGCYWIAYEEGKKINPTIVGFTEYESINVEYSDEGN